MGRIVGKELLNISADYLTHNTGVKIVSKTTEPVPMTSMVTATVTATTTVIPEPEEGPQNG